MGEVYQSTQEHIQLLTQLGFTVNVMLECEGNQLKQFWSDIQQFIQHLDMVLRLDPREAFFGGQTIAIPIASSDSKRNPAHDIFKQFLSVHYHS